MIKVRNDEVIKALGVRVRQLRKDKGLTMEKLAELAGIDFRQVAYIEHGQVNATISMMFAIATAKRFWPLGLLLVQGMHSGCAFHRGQSTQVGRRRG